jgi:hypothetical protein
MQVLALVERDERCHILRTERSVRSLYYLSQILRRYFFRRDVETEYLKRQLLERFILRFTLPI